MAPNRVISSMSCKLYNSLWYVSISTPTFFTKLIIWIDSSRLDSWMRHDPCSIGQRKDLFHCLPNYLHCLRHSRRTHSKLATCWLVCQRVGVDECHLLHHHVSLSAGIPQDGFDQSANGVDSMAAAGKGESGIDFQAVFASTRVQTQEAIRTFAGPPPDHYQQQANGFAGQFGGVNSMICAHSPLPSSLLLKLTLS
jgi:hypothetical protein